jgi:hypothetical protein
MFHSQKTPRRRCPTGLLLAFLGLPACGSAGHSLLISVNPPDASLYINGERVSQGGRRTHVLTFDKQQRVCVQATAPNYEPHFEWITEAEVLDLSARNNNELPITLRPRR